MTYNYDTFKASFYNFAEDKGLPIGSTLPDFALTDMVGNPVQVLDYRGMILVLETGSYTCPQYVGRIQPMNQLAQQFPDFEFVTLYVREAHPGNKLPEHHTMQEKQAFAEKLRDTESENRTILLDSVDGAMHRALGAMPNTLYIMDADGVIIFRSDWNHIPAVREVLTKLALGETVQRHDYNFRPVQPKTLFRVLLRSGVDAVVDFFVALPRLLWGHVKAAQSH